MKRFVLAAATTTSLAACGVSGSTAVPTPAFRGVTQVHITRANGLLVLPPIDRIITDSSVVNRLATDIQRLPLFPQEAISCPAGLGVSYTLAFAGSAGIAWSAVIDTSGCTAVTLTNGPTRRGDETLFANLGAVLGLPRAEVVPLPCLQTGGDVGYRFASPQAA